MIKNIILDIGGIILDDSKENLRKYLQVSKEETEKLYKIVYGSKGFRQYLLGYINLEECMNLVISENQEYKDYIEKMLLKSNLKDIVPIKSDVLQVIRKLKERYKIYFLSNITKETYEYIEEILNEFDGGIYSFKVHLCKPNPEIYKKLLYTYNLKKEESIFFDDRQRNVDIGNKLGIKSIKFNTEQDILDVLQIRKYIQK